MNVVPVRFPDDLYEQLQALAKVYDTSMAAIVREATKEKIAKQPKKIKRKLRYCNPLLELAKEAEKLPATKYYYPELSDDELLYDQAR